MAEYENMPAGMQALQILIQKIRKGEFSPGQPLKETVISKEENLNRNAVREALNQLVGYGIVEYRAFRGYRFKEFTLQDKLEWYELREAIEPIATRRLAKKQDKDVIAALELILKEQENALKKGDKETFNYSDLMFHLTVIRHCGNETFVRQHNDLYVATLFTSTPTFPFNDPILNSARFYKYDYDENNKETLRVHREILRFIKNGEANEAELLSRRHAKNQVETMEKLIAALDSDKAALYEKINIFDKKLNQHQNISALKSNL